MHVIRGQILAQRMFNIADEVDLHRAEVLVHALTRKPQFVRSAPHIRLPNPPLAMTLSGRSPGLDGLAACDVLVRLYDVGCLAITFSIDLPTPMDAEALIAFGARILEHEDVITAAAKPIAEEILGGIVPVCKLPQMSDVYEEYTIFRIEEVSPGMDADGLHHALDISRLLVGERGKLSAIEQEHITHSSLSYSPDELVVIDWNSALVFGPANETDVQEILEFTAVQLLELRVYNDMMERALAGLYTELEQKQRLLFRSAKYQRLSHRIMRLYVELMEISERVDNSLQFLGDTWLARLHRAAITEFTIPKWQRLLRNKLEIVRQINALLVDQITARKSLNVELAIVLLIVIELIVALYPR